MGKKKNWEQDLEQDELEFSTDELTQLEHERSNRASVSHTGRPRRRTHGVPLEQSLPTEARPRTKTLPMVGGLRGTPQLRPLTDDATGPHLSAPALSAAATAARGPSTHATPSGNAPPPPPSPASLAERLADAVGRPMSRGPLEPAGTGYSGTGHSGSESVGDPEEAATEPFLVRDAGPGARSVSGAGELDDSSDDIGDIPIYEDDSVPRPESADTSSGGNGGARTDPARSQPWDVSVAGSPEISAQGGRSGPGDPSEDDGQQDNALDTSAEFLSADLLEEEEGDTVEMRPDELDGWVEVSTTPDQSPPQPAVEVEREWLPASGDLKTGPVWLSADQLEDEPDEPDTSAAKLDAVPSPISSEVGLSQTTRAGLDAAATEIVEVPPTDVEGASLPDEPAFGVDERVLAGNVSTPDPGAMPRPAGRQLTGFVSGEVPVPAAVHALEHAEVDDNRLSAALDAAAGALRTEAEDDDDQLVSGEDLAAFDVGVEESTPSPGAADAMAELASKHVPVGETEAERSNRVSILLSALRAPSRAKTPSRPVPAVSPRAVSKITGPLRPLATERLTKEELERGSQTGEQSALSTDQSSERAPDPPDAAQPPAEPLHGTSGSGTSGSGTSGSGTSGSGESGFAPALPVKLSRSERSAVAAERDTVEVLVPTELRDEAAAEQSAPATPTSPFPLAADLVAPPEEGKKPLSPFPSDEVTVTTGEVHVRVTEVEVLEDGVMTSALDDDGEDKEQVPGVAVAAKPPTPPSQKTSTPAAPQKPPKAPPPAPRQAQAKNSELRPAGAGRTAAAKTKTPPPMPAADARPRRRSKEWFEEVFDDNYLKTVPFARPESTRIEANFLEQALLLHSGSRLLDVGCGDGRHAIELAARGYRVTGLDLSLPLLIRAADQAQERKLDVNFVHRDFRDISFDQEFDAAYCLNTSFGYLDDDSNRKMIRAINNALEPGGRLVLEVVNRDYMIKTLPARTWWEGAACVVLEEIEFNYFTSRLMSKRSVVFEDGSHVEQAISVRLYSLHELGKVLHHAGLRVLEVSGHYGHRTRFFGNQSRSLILLAERRR